MSKIYFIILTIIVNMMQLGMLYMVIRGKKDKYPWKPFVGCILGTCLCTISYAISVNVQSYFAMSFWSSTYFVSIDMMLVCLLFYTIRLTDNMKMSLVRYGTVAAVCYAVFDIVVLLINPFFQIVLNYRETNGIVVSWKYDGYLLFNVHLFFCYVLMIFSFYNLLKKCISIPKIYRRKYSLILEGLLFVVFLNALFLYLPTLKILEYDISVFFYSIILFLIYHNTMYYADQNLITGVSKEILLDMNNPLILFDYEKKYVFHLDGEMAIFPDHVDAFCMQDLIQYFNLGNYILTDNKDVSFQWTYQGIVYRSDFKIIRKKESIVGYYFSFVNVPYEYDLLTAFHTENATMAYIDHDERIDEYPLGILICDLNKLSLINEEYGKTTGDKAIETVAGFMKKICPEDAYLSRFHDALLVALCPKKNLAEMNKLSEKMMQENIYLKEENLTLQIQSATAVCNTVQNSDIVSGIRSAQKSLRIKKMLDPDSMHSSLLYSLVRILQEADQGTEQHVIRTRELGRCFGQKLELSDEEIANLELLCLLHDVGKICIPLEILNKPGKLNEDERRVMKTHAEKGYSIANASSELRPIADRILHHHEFWNGKGYPSGLTGEEIPLLSRMICIIDAYDAMISDRPYRNNIGTKKAIEELEDYAGIQFDPYLVSEFVEMIRSNSQFYKEENAAGKDIQDRQWIMGEDAENQKVPVRTVEYANYYLDTSDFQIVRADGSFQKITGYSDEDIRQLKLTQNDLIFKEDIGKYWATVNAAMQHGSEAFLEHRLRRKDGTGIYVYCDGVKYFDSALNKNMFRILVADVTTSIALQREINKERDIAKLNQERWQESLRMDSLCEIMNRTAFRSELQALLLKNDCIVVMMMCDLDNFKNYNDRYGHIMGDKLLKGFAKLLKNAAREQDLVCRMGGDEFAAAILFSKDMDLEEVKSVLFNRWKEMNNNLKSYGDGLSSSIGFAMSVGKEKSFNQLYQESDNALYHSKENGKNCCSFDW